MSFICYKSAWFRYKSAWFRYQSALLLLKCPIQRDKSALPVLPKCPMLRKFPVLVTKVPYKVTKVPFLGYKSALSSLSLSLSLSYIWINRLPEILAKRQVSKFSENWHGGLISRQKRVLGGFVCPTKEYYRHKYAVKTATKPTARNYIGNLSVCSLNEWMNKWFARSKICYHRNNGLKY